MSRQETESLACKLYGGRPVIYERHRHRYEVCMCTYIYIYIHIYIYIYIDRERERERDVTARFSCDSRGCTLRTGLGYV